MAVEDDKDMQFLVSVVLSSDKRLAWEGGAASASEGVELARELQPDLIILDHFIEGDVMGLQAAPLCTRVVRDIRGQPWIGNLFRAHDLARTHRTQLGRAINTYTVSTRPKHLLRRLYHTDVLGLLMVYTRNDTST